MKDINLILEWANVTAKTIYHPVPCRGIVHEVNIVCNIELDIDNTVTISRGTSAVNLVTPAADNTAAGTVITGVPDTTYKDLIFDPESATAANKVLKIAVPNTIDAACTLGINIKYDDSAAVTQSST